MKKLLGCLLLAILLPVVALGLVLLSGLSQQPLYQSTAPEAAEIALAKQALSRNYQAYKAAGTTQAAFSKQELQALSALLSHTFPRLSLAPLFEQDEYQLGISFALPRDYYFNLRLALQTQLQLSQLQVGSISLPAGASQELLLFVLERYYEGLQPRRLQLGLAEASHSMDSSGLYWLLSPELKAELKRGFKYFSKPELPLQHRQAVAHYYNWLRQQSGQYRGQARVSLLSYLQPLAEQALLRAEGKDIVEEQRAMLWALGIYLAHGKFQQLLAKPYLQDIKLGAAPANVVLAERHDLLLHYIYSCMLAVAGDSLLSSAMGEFKELFDSLEGGSGFSFADLAADRAGLQLALSLESEVAATQFLRVLSNATQERVFFPSVDGLQEQLTELEFNQRYGGLQSEAYLQTLTEIDQMVAQLPAYQRDTGS